MGSEWTTIGSISQVFDGPHATPKKLEEGPYFLSISSLENGKLNLEKSARLSEQDFKKWTQRVTPTEGDILFSYETRLGEAALMPSGIRACLGRRMGLLRPDRDRVIPRYLLYAYLSPDFQTEIRTRTNPGATVDRLAIKELPDFPLRIPTLQEQKTIAHILGSLDDKIELNRQMNETLEAMAQALFKSWFVDFDPVIDNALAAGNPIPEALQAKAAARQALGDKRKPLPEAIQQQFPSAFEFSDELGWIPEGGESSTLKALVEVTDYVANGSFAALKSNVEYQEEPDHAVLIRLADFNRGWKSNFVYVTKDSYEFLAKSSLEVGDVIISNVGANAGTTFKAPDLGKPMTLGPNSIVVKTGDNKALKSYLYYYFVSPLGQAQIQSIISGSAQPKFNKTDFRALEVFYGSMEIVQGFHAITEPWIAKLDINQADIRALEQTRDTLLPQLLSGELRIPDAEKLVAEAL